MRGIGEVLRLKAAGMNNSDIARSTGIGRTTVYGTSRDLNRLAD